MGKKTVYTLVVDDYFPELCSLTLPNHDAYARKIGADFVVIRQRQFPDWAPTYEKLQIFNRGKHQEWNIHIDADVLVNPSMVDVSQLDPLSIHGYATYDPAPYYKIDQYFFRDGRRLGVASSFVAVPYACHDFWTPLEMQREHAESMTTRRHGIDDYCFSRNVARFALRWSHLSEPGHIHHLCAGGDSRNEKDMIAEARNVISSF